MADLTITQGSWLNRKNLLEYKGVIFWDHTDLPDIEFNDDDQYVQLTAEQARRIDLLAHDTYGDSELMWVILQANGKDLPNQFVEGELIRVPARSTIEQLLSPQEIA